MNILVGCDPEIFVKSTNGELLSAWNMIPGTKKAPFPVEKGAVQVDGMALEFNIDPAVNEEEFASNTLYVMEQMRKMIPHELFISPVAHFGFQMLKDQPAEALELGCDPDYNGCTLNANPRPDGDRPFRTASGHVHVGWANGRNVLSGEAFDEAAAVARQLDFYLGIPSLFVDGDTTRRELYGQAGAFRNKEYGMEYRVLSNFWLKSADLMKWVFRSTRKAVEDMFTYHRYLPMEHGDIQTIINTSDVRSAHAICKQYGLEVPNAV